MMKRQPIAFNLDNPHQRDLYEWCAAQSTNFSGFVKDVLFAYRSSGSIRSAPVVGVAIEEAPVIVPQQQATSEKKILSIF